MARERRVAQITGAGQVDHVVDDIGLTDTLPVTKVGKIDKKALRADIAARVAAPSGP